MNREQNLSHKDQESPVQEPSSERHAGFLVPQSFRDQRASERALCDIEEQEKKQLETFSFQTPKLLCRWRLVKGGLPLANRHLRALSARYVDGKRINPEFVAWTKQRLEQNLDTQLLPGEEGVLMLALDSAGQGLISTGPYQPLKNNNRAALILRAMLSAREAQKTRVAPEALWLVKNKQLSFLLDDSCKSSASSGLVADLAKTLGIPIMRNQKATSYLEEAAARNTSAAQKEVLKKSKEAVGTRLEEALKNLEAELSQYDEVFLVSDEHGIVPEEVSTQSQGGKLQQGSLVSKFVESYCVLLKKTSASFGR